MHAVRRHLGDLRRRLGIQPGDELEHTLIAVEALAETISGMSSNAARLIAEGERNVGMIVSAAMTRQVLWRMYGVPAVVGALVASVVLAIGLIIHGHTDSVQRELDRTIQVEAWSGQRAAVEAERQVLVQERTDVAAEKARIESTLPGLLLDRANHLSGAARDIVQMEAAAPGMVDYLSGHWHETAAILKLNNYDLCPRPSSNGQTTWCTYQHP